MTEPLVDPQLTAFFASDPTILREEEPLEEDGLDPHALEEVAIAIAVAFLVVRRFVVKDLQDAHPDLKDPKQLIRSAWRRRAPIWLQLTVPAIKKGYELGLITEVSQEELEVMAQSYAEDLGEYVNETSATALVEGFNEQLAVKWSDQLAWHRASAAFGLDSQQMRAYVRGTINSSDKDPQFELLPARAQQFLDKAIMQRAEKLGGHEAWQSMEMGKALAWMSQKNAGLIPVDAQKQWLTAADERVCPQCGPLNRKRVALDEQFVTPDGNKYWAPGVHPNCRCDIKLLYPEIANDPWQMVTKAEPGDPFDRDRKGRFSRVESRTVETKTAEPRPPDPALEGLLQDLKSYQASTDAAEDAKQSTQAANPWAVKDLNPFRQSAEVANPWAGTKSTNPWAKEAVTNPFAQATTSPFKDVASNPFTVAPTAKTNRQVIIFLPNGQTAPVEATEIPRGAQIPLYVFAHDWHANEYGHGDPIDSDLDVMTPGRVISFDHRDYSSSAVATTAKPWHYTYGNLYNEAAARYDDAEEFKTPEAERELETYHRQWEDWAADINDEDMSRLVNQLADYEVIQIAKDGGVEFRPGYEPDAGDIRGDLMFATGNKKLMNSFMYHLEHDHPQWIGGEDGIGAELDRTRKELFSMSLVPHTPAIFVLPTQHGGTAYVGDEAILHGKYQVYKVELRDGNTDAALRSDMRGGKVDSSPRPANVQGLRMVYLRPVDDWVEEPSDDGARAAYDSPPAWMRAYGDHSEDDIYGALEEEEQNNDW